MNNLNILLCLSVLAIGFVNCYPKSSRNACSKDSECKVGNECCFKPVLSFVPYLMSEEGECKTYLEENDDCFLYAFNGCGCREGLECKDFGFQYPPIFVGPWNWLETKGPLPSMKCVKAAAN